MPYADKVEGLGTAGTATGGVVTVQGIATGVAQPVDTEMPAAVALSDALANPTAPAVGAYLLVWDAVAGTWRRSAIGAGPSNQSLRVVPAGYDSAKFNAPAANTIATVTFAATAGKRWQLDNLYADVRNTAAGAVFLGIRVWDGATGTTQVANYLLGLTAVAGASDRIFITGLSILGTIGNALTIDGNAALGATVTQSISAGCYQI